MTHAVAEHRDVPLLSDTQVAHQAWSEVYSQLDLLPRPVALSVLAWVSHDLLRRTAELPDTEHGLLLVLTEYRHAIFAFATVADNSSRPSTRGRG